MKTPIRAIIVDDEPIARERLSMLLTAEERIEVTGEFDNGQKALEYLQAQPVDLAFIDVQMPEMDGMSLLKALPKNFPTYVVLVTAFDDYALTAFDLSVVDYLLKPYSRDRFRQAMERFYQVKKGESDQPEFVRNGVAVSKVAVKLGNRTYFVPIEEIEYVEASGNYLELYAGGKVHVIRETMTHMVSRLPNSFLRIHKSNIINVDFVSELISIGYGDYELRMLNGKVLRVSDSYKKPLLQLLNC